MAVIPKKIDQIASNKFKAYLKVYLVLKYKGFSWQKELQNDFNIEDSVAKESLKLLEKEGFVISKNFYDLDLDFQEIIRRTNASYLEKINSYPKVYTLNEDEIRNGWWECNKDKIEFLIKDDGSFMHTLQLAKQKKLAQNKVKIILEEENQSKTRIIRKDYKQGIIYESKSTLGKKQTLYFEKAKQEIKKLKLERKKQLTKNENNELILLNQKGTEIIAKEKKANQLTIKKLTINEKEVSEIEFDEKINELKKYEKNSKKYEKQLDDDFKNYDKEIKEYNNSLKKCFKKKEEIEIEIEELNQKILENKFSENDNSNLEILENNKHKTSEEEIKFDKLLIKKKEFENLKKEYNELEDKQYKEIKKINNQTQILGIGKSIEDIDNISNKRLTSLFEELGIIENNINTNNKTNEKFEKLKNELLKNKFLDIYKTIDELENKEEFKKFQEYIKDLKVKSDDEDLILIK